MIYPRRICALEPTQDAEIRKLTLAVRDAQEAFIAAERKVDEASKLRGQYLAELAQHKFNAGSDAMVEVIDGFLVVGN